MLFPNIHQFQLLAAPFVPLECTTSLFRNSKSFNTNLTTIVLFYVDVHHRKAPSSAYFWKETAIHFIHFNNIIAVQCDELYLCVYFELTQKTLKVVDKWGN